MKGKFSTKTIVIIALTVLLLAIGVTGTVLFLKDSGEAAAMEEKNVLPVTGTNDEPESGAETPINQENQGENGGEQQTEETPNTTVNTTGETTSTRTTTPTQSTREITQEPETSTVEREKVIAESKELNWNKFSLTEDADNLNKNINYNNLKCIVNYYIEGTELIATEMVKENRLGTLIVSLEKDKKNEYDKIIDLNKYLPTGYKLDEEKTTKTPFEITNNESQNIMNIYYVKNDAQTKEIAYTVEHYVDGIYKAEDDFKETKTVWINDNEIEVTYQLDKEKYIGYKYESDDIEKTAENGKVFKVNYVKDNSQTKEITYTVEHYVDGVHKAKDDFKKTKTVWINDDEIEVTYQLDKEKYIGYKYESDDIEKTAENGKVFKVNYVKDDSQTKEITYTVKHYIDGIEKERKTYTSNVWINEINLQIQIQKDSLNKKNYIGYEFENISPKVKEGDKVADGTEIILNYKARADLSYKIIYHYNSKEEKTEEITGKKYGEVVYLKDIQDRIESNKTYKGKEYEHIKTTTKQQPLVSGLIIIGTDLSKNIINVYYERPEIKAEKTSVITTTADKGKAHVGDVIRYTIKVWNTGKISKDLTVKDLVPTGTTLNENSIVLSNGTKTVTNNKEITWNVNVPANTSEENAETITFEVKINQDAVGTKITNTAYIDGEKVKDQKKYEVIKPADIIVNKKSSKTGKVSPGDIITYTLVATNSGEEKGTTLIRDTIPQGTKLQGEIKIIEKGKNVKTINDETELASGVTVNVEPGKETAKIEFSVVVLPSSVGKIIENQAHYDEKTTEKKENQSVIKMNVIANAGVTQTKGLNYIIVADASNSMSLLYVSAGVTREKAAEKAISSFIGKVFSEASDAKVELIKFNKKAEHIMTYTKNSNHSVNLGKTYQVTDIKAGLELAGRYKVNTTKNVIILLSDGKPESLNPKYKVEKDPERLAAVADKLEDNNTKIYCIGFGNKANNPENEAYKVLAKISTNGKVLISENTDELIENFTEINYQETEPIKIELNELTKTFDLGNKQLDPNRKVEITYAEGKEQYTFNNLGTQGPLTYSKDETNYKLTFDLTDYAEKANLQIKYYVK